MKSRTSYYVSYPTTRKFDCQKEAIPSCGQSQVPSCTSKSTHSPVFPAESQHTHVVHCGQHVIAGLRFAWCYAMHQNPCSSLEWSLFTRSASDGKHKAHSDPRIRLVDLSIFDGTHSNTGQCLMLSGEALNVVRDEAFNFGSF
eukprot:3828587-Amphidinium_carterae.1